MRTTNDGRYFQYTDATPLILTVIDAIAGWVKRYRQRRADIAVLRSLSARELKDMGIYPADIDFIIKHR